VPEANKHFEPRTCSRHNGSRFIQVHHTNFEGGGICRYEKLAAAAHARQIVPVVMLDVLRSSELAEDDQVGRAPIGAVVLLFPRNNALFDIVHEQRVVEFSGTDIEGRNTPTAAGEAAVRSLTKRCSTE
jgi:hypothetical protein